MPTVAEQQQWWDEWNTKYRTVYIDPTSEREAEVAIGWIKQIHASKGRLLEILDVGCGTGWLCDRLTPFGRVSGTDIAAEVVARAQARNPEISYTVGDFAALDFPTDFYNVIVSLEVLSHVADQPAWMAKVASLLVLDGYLLLFNQNRTILERHSDIDPQGSGQLRRWTSPDELRGLAAPHFVVEELRTLTPAGDRGLLRIANSYKVNRIIGGPRFDRWKERMGMGRTLAARLRKR